MIVEADESDGTFIKIPTQIGVVTNIDPEHLDYFKTVENMHREFETFFRNIPFYGLAVACIDHPVVARHDRAAGAAARRPPPADLRHHARADLVLKSARVEGAATFFDADLGARVRGGARTLKGWSVPIPGHHNALNALAAIAAASEAGIGDDTIRAAMAELLRRQAPLPAHRHLERRGDLRRLRPSSGRDRRRAEGGARPARAGA